MTGQGKRGGKWMLKHLLPGDKHIIKTADSHLPAKKVLNAISSSTTKAMNAAGCAVMLLNQKREHLTIIASYGLSYLYLRKGILNVHRSLPEIMEGKIAAVTSISKDNRMQYPEAASMEKINSILGAPIFLDGHVIGEIRVYTDDVRVFNQMEKDFVTTVAGVIALSINKNDVHAKSCLQLKQQEQSPPSGTQMTELHSFAKLQPSQRGGVCQTARFQRMSGFTYRGHSLLMARL